MTHAVTGVLCDIPMGWASEGERMAHLEKLRRQGVAEKP